MSYTPLPAVGQMNDIMEHLTDNLHGDIINYTYAKSMWTTLPRKVEFPGGIGSQVNNLIYERSYLTEEDGTTVVDVEDEGQWSKVSARQQGVPGAGPGDLFDQTDLQGVANSNNPQPTFVRFLHRRENMSLDIKVIQSERINVTNLFEKWESDQQMDMMTEGLGEQNMRYLVERHRSEYIDACENKLILVDNDCFENNLASTWGAAVPGFELTQGVLKHIHERMVLEGAGDYAESMIDGDPVFVVNCSKQTAENLKLEPEFRQDLRDTGRGEELLGSLGIKSAYWGFSFALEKEPPRYTTPDAGTTWVRVPATIKIGNKVVQNPAWHAADYEDTVIWCPSVMEVAIPSFPTSIGGAEFGKQQVIGADFQWLNIPHEITNPTRDTGFFHQRIVQATKRKKLRHGWVIRHKRPVRQLDLA